MFLQPINLNSIVKFPNDIYIMIVLAEMRKNFFGMIDSSGDFLVCWPTWFNVMVTKQDNNAIFLDKQCIRH